MSEKIEYYQNALITQIIGQDIDPMVKSAQDVSVQGIIGGVKNYVLSNINPENPTASVLSMFAPMVITKIFQAMGFGWISYLFGILASVFRVDVANIIASVCSGVKSLVSGGKQTSSEQISGVVDDVISSHAGQSTEELGAKSFEMQIRDAKLFKLALIDYKNSLENNVVDFNKTSSRTSVTRTTGLHILGGILKWVMLTIAGAGGMLLAGDAVRKTLQLDNALDNTLQHGKEKDKPSMSPNQPLQVRPKIIQTKYKLNPIYKDIPLNPGWTESIINNRQNIENMVMTFANEVYLGLENKDSQMKSSIGFNGVVDSIEDLNRKSTGNRIVSIPEMFKTKKDIVDSFIEDL